MGAGPVDVAEDVGAVEGRGSAKEGGRGGTRAARSTVSMASLHSRSSAIIVMVVMSGACGCTDVTSPLANTVTADRVLIEKSARRLTLLSEGRPLKSYDIALGRSPVGAKIEEGDNRTPEGNYSVDSRKADSGYHRALHLSYPNASDLEHAKQLGVAPGGDIMIHGIRNGFGWLGPLHRRIDWTRGCIAVTDGEIEEIWSVVPDGTVVEIRP